MARNKYPEETIAKILDAALELFCEKGYEETTMADIVEKLGGLSKGAVYHHFRSKEEIFTAALERASAPAVSAIEATCSDPRLTAVEKLSALYSDFPSGPAFDLWEKAKPSSDPIRSSRLLAAEYVNSLDLASKYVLPVLLQGQAEGTVFVDDPLEVAEVLTLISNLWCSPVFNPGSHVDIHRRATVFARVAEGLGVPLEHLGDRSGS